MSSTRDGVPSQSAGARPVPSQREEKDGIGRSLGQNMHGFDFEGMGPSVDRMRKVVSIDESDLISPLMLGKTKTVDDDFSLDRQPVKQHSAGLGKRMSGRHNSQAVVDGQPLQTPPTIDGTVDARAPHKLHNLIEEISTWVQDERARRKARKERRKERARGKSNLSDRLKAHKWHGRDKDTDLSTDGRRGSDSSESGNSDALERLEQIIERNASGSLVEKTIGRKQSTRPPRRYSTRKMRMSTTETDVEPEVLPPSCEAILDNTKTLSYYGGSSSTHADASAKPASTSDREAWLTFKYEIVRLAHTLKLKGWRQVSMEHSAQIDVERLSGALTNAVYVVTAPKDLPSKQPDSISSTPLLQPRRPPPKLLLRIYGPQVEHLIDREAELKILRRLAKKRIGPRMLGTFTNGRFEEFFHARTLKPQDLRDPATSKQIAKRMRELHEGIELLDEERDGGPFVWRNWDSWMERCEKVVTYIDQQVMLESNGDSVVNQDFKKRGLVCGTDWKFFKRTVEKYRAWLDEQYGGADRLREQLVFAHNDTQYGNILRLEPPGESPLLLPANQHKQLVVIDFEYSNANMPGLEFANHFTEWCYNYHDPSYSFACQTAAYPTPDEQRRFLRAYVVHRPQYNPAAMSTPRLIPRELSLSTSSLPPGNTPAAVSNLSLKSMPMNSSTPALASATIVERPSLSTSLSNLTLDSRMGTSRPQSSYFDVNGPGAGDYLGTSLTSEPDQLDEEDEIEAEITGLMHETRLWRLANSAQWVAWGIVQAHIPGMEKLSISGPASGNTSQSATPRPSPHPAPQAQPPVQLEPNEATDPLSPEAEQAAEDLADKRPEEDVEDEGFDYLSYARERALFFWGDALQFGFVTEDELADWGLRVGGSGEPGTVKIVQY